MIIVNVKTYTYVFSSVIIGLCQSNSFHKMMFQSQKVKEEASLPKTAKRGRETAAQEAEEPEKTTPKRPKTRVIIIN